MFSCFILFTCFCWLLEFVYLSDSTFYNPRGNYVTWLRLDVGNPPKILEKKLWKHEAWRNRCSGKLNRQQHKNDKEPRTRTQRDILLLSSFLYSAPSKGGQTQRVLHKIALKKSFFEATKKSRKEEIKLRKILENLTVNNARIELLKKVYAPRSLSHIQTCWMVDPFRHIFHEEISRNQHCATSSVELAMTFR